MERVDGAGGCQRRAGCEDRRLWHAEPCLRSFGGGADGDRHRPVMGDLVADVYADADQGEKSHHRDDRPSLPPVAHHPPERPRQRETDRQQKVDLDPVGPRRRVLERMGGVGVEEAAAVRSQFLDGLLRGDRATGDRLLAAGDRRDGGEGVEVVDRAGTDEDDRHHEGDRKQDPQAGPGQVDPEVAELVGAVPRESAYQCDRDRDTDRGRQEVLHGKTGHLHEVAGGGLTGIRLPVGVGDEARRGVEREVRFESRKAEVQEQYVLNPEEQVEKQHGDQRERQHAPQVGRPRLLGIGVDPGQPVDAALGPAVAGPREDARHVIAEVAIGDGQRHRERGDEDDDGGGVTHSEPLREH